MQIHILMPILSLCGVSWSSDGTDNLTENVAESTEEASVESVATLRPWAQLQTWATLMDQDRDVQADPASYGDPEHDVGFLLRRARLGLEGDIALQRDAASGASVDYAISVGVASPYDAISPSESDVALVDAFSRVTLPSGGYTSSLSVGIQRVPFHREGLMSSVDLLFQERSVGGAWIEPGRETGAVLGQQLSLGDGNGSLWFRGGVYNGNQRWDGDNDPGLMLSGRLEYLQGDAYRTWSASREGAFGLGVAAQQNQQLATASSGLNADMLARWRGWCVQAEFQTDTTEPADTLSAPAAVSSTTTRVGYMGQLSHFLVLNGVSGLEIGARFATLDDATHRDDLGDVWTVHGGLTWREVLPFVDVGVGYIARGEPASADRPNDSLRMWTQLRPVLF